MANWKRYYIDQSLFHWVYINMSDIREKCNDRFFFLNRHPSSPKHFPHQWQFFYLRKGLELIYFLSVGWFVKIDTNHCLFSNMCSMDIEPPRSNHHSSRVNSKQNKHTPQTDIEHTLHHPLRIKIYSLEKIKCLPDKNHASPFQA